MSITTATRFEFRCTSCYQSILGETDAAGSNVECHWCGNSMLAPASTETAISRARAFEEGEQVLAGVKIVPDEPVRSSEERAALARQLAQQHAKSRNVRCKKPADRSASRMARLLAVLLDTFLVSAVCGGCFAFGMLTYEVGLADILRRASSLPLGFWVSFSGIPGALILFHWCTISLYGKTIGKYLLKIRIVDSSGCEPGFMRGVVIRQSIAGLTTVVPYIPILHYMELWPDELAFDTRTMYIIACIVCMALALADIIAIFLEPPRCLHDRLAGTYVIDD